MGDLLVVPMILLVAVVVPLWLLLHYITRWRSSRSLSAEDERMLVELWESARRMERRIGALETILDQNAPGLRRKS